MPLADIHKEPGRYSSYERAAAMMNMMIERGDLPEGWKVDVPIMTKPGSPIMFGESGYGTSAYTIEGFMLGLAMASGTISLGKCREWLNLTGVQQPHELSMFGMKIRDLCAIEDEDVNLPARKKAKAKEIKKHKP